jgi:hypothetical protein
MEPVESGCQQILFAAEMAEQRHLVHSGRRGNFLRRRAVISFFRHLHVWGIRIHNDLTFGERVQKVFRNWG